MTVYELVYNTLGGQHLGCGDLFASEEAALASIHKIHAKSTGEWEEKRGRNGELTVRFREVTPVRRLPRYCWEWYISPIEVNF